MTSTQQLAEITLTESAAAAVRQLMAKHALQDHALRLFISAGGCSGWQYGLALEGDCHEEDTVFEQHGIRLVVDEVSLNYLRGATVDYTEALMGGSFVISNPNAVKSCRCGQSFHTQGDNGSPSGCACG